MKKKIVDEDLMHPTILPQHLHIAVTALLTTVHIG
jgi:hypothetical protein